MSATITTRLIKSFTITSGVVLDIKLHTSAGGSGTVLTWIDRTGTALNVNQTFSRITVLNESAQDIYYNIRTDLTGAFTLATTTEEDLMRVPSGQMISEFHLYKRVRFKLFGGAPSAIRVIFEYKKLGIQSEF